MVESSLALRARKISMAVFETTTEKVVASYTQVELYFTRNGKACISHLVHKMAQEQAPFRKLLTLDSKTAFAVFFVCVDIL